MYKTLFSLSICRETEKHEVKRKKFVHKSVQTGEAVVTASDLESDEPSVDYWKTLAEKRGEALNDSLQENEKLKEDISNLIEENSVCKAMLDESKNLIEVLQVYFLVYFFLCTIHRFILQEMLDEPNTSTEVAEEATENETL